MLRRPKGARRYNDIITLTKVNVGLDDYGHKVVSGHSEVMKTYASVQQISATKTFLTFQQANIVGLEIEFRAVDKEFDGILWQGHKVEFAQPEIVDNRGRIVKVTGYYRLDRV